MFGWSDRKRQLARDAAAAQLPAGAGVQAVVVGRAHARWSPQATMWAAAFCGVSVAYVMFTGGLLLPGVLLGAFFADRVVAPRRALAYCEHGIAVFGVSALSDKPHQLVARVGHNPTAWDAARITHRVVVDGDVLHFAPKELAHVLRCLDDTAPPAVATPPAHQPG